MQSFILNEQAIIINKSGVTLPVYIFAFRVKKKRQIIYCKSMSLKFAFKFRKRYTHVVFKEPTNL